LIKDEYVKFIDGVFEASESDPVITTIKDHELNLGNFEVRYHKMLILVIQIQDREEFESNMIKD
jgi:hypothetical protein